MAKKKVTETDCQRLVKEVHTEERVKLEERFKEAVKNQKKIVESAKKSIKHSMFLLGQEEERLMQEERDFCKLEESDLDQWGKDNPEAIPAIFAYNPCGGFAGGLSSKALTFDPNFDKYKWINDKLQEKKARHNMTAFEYFMTL